jgi:hypothetical protein
MFFFNYEVIEFITDDGRNLPIEDINISFIGTAMSKPNTEIEWFETISVNKNYKLSVKLNSGSH